MKKILLIILAIFVFSQGGIAQEIIPFDTAHWKFNGRNIIENYRGKKAVYNQGGSIELKDVEFLNGTIEFDLFLKETQAFPGVFFRVVNGSNGEEFYIRPHLPGKPDANQVAPIINGISPWQLNFGPRYSFPYQYNYDDWTHIKVVVNENRAQVFLDYAEKPNLSWNLFHSPQAGKVILRGGNAQALHIADVKVDKNKTELVDFSPIERASIERLIPTWEVSDMFEEKLLADPSTLTSVIQNRKWGKKIHVEEGTAANISRVQNLYDGSPGETVFAKITITSDKDQVKLLEFGYSDRVVAILNSQPIYRGTNMWRSRDYRYLGTIGLFDAIYLPLKKGENTLLMAVSESFGGWLITGRFADEKGIKIK